VTGFRVENAAATLMRLIDDPEFAGQTWTWDKIGGALGLNIRQAREVIYHIRRTATDLVWTVGTFGSDYESMPTTSSREAWPGLLNQLLHLKTRLATMHHTWEVLSRVDPEPRYARAAGREARAYGRWHEEVEDRIDNLMILFGEDPDGGVTV
jgi:hypothetical protein